MVLRDRLEEFLKTRSQHPPSASSSYSKHSSEPSQTSAQSDLLTTYRHPLNNGARSHLFLQHANELNSSIERLYMKFKLLQRKQAEVLSQTLVSHKDKEELSELIGDIKFGIRSLRPKISELGKELHISSSPGQLLDRMRKNHCEVLKMRLNELLTEFNKTQFEYKQRISRRVKRQLDLAGHYLTNHEVNRLLDDKTHQIFYRELNPISVAAKMAVEDAANRHSELITLEESVNELNEIFRDVLCLIYSQNEMVDRIETNVQAAADFTEHGNVQVRKAVTYKKSAERVKCFTTMLAITTLMAVLLILIMILLTFLLRK